MRLEASEAELKVDATEVLVTIQCHVYMIPLVQQTINCEQNKSTGYNQYSQPSHDVDLKQIILTSLERER